MGGVRKLKFLQFIVVGAIIGLVVGMLNLPSYSIAIAAVVLFIGVMGSFITLPCLPRI